MKKSLLLLCLLWLNIAVYGQRFMQGLGGTLSLGRGIAKYSGEKTAAFFTGITYSPRYNFITKEHTSWSIGMPITIGFGFTPNVLDIASGLKFGYDLPLAIDFNFGAKATTTSTDVWGGYLGTGFSYFNMNTYKTSSSTFAGKSYGPLVRTGIRINPKWHRGFTSINLGFSWKYGLEDDRLRTYNFSLIGDW